MKTDGQVFYELSMDEIGFELGLTKPAILTRDQLRSLFEVITTGGGVSRIKVGSRSPNHVSGSTSYVGIPNVEINSVFLENIQAFYRAGLFGNLTFMKFMRYDGLGDMLRQSKVVPVSKYLGRT